MTASAPFGYFPGTKIPRKRPDPYFEGRGECKSCGTPGLIWEMITDSTNSERRTHWVLVDMGGKKHVCPRGTR